MSTLSQVSFDKIPPLYLKEIDLKKKKQFLTIQFLAKKYTSINHNVCKNVIYNFIAMFKVKGILYAVC